MKRKFQAVKGTRDIRPPESGLWNRVEQTARQVLGSYNYQEIRLPLFEETEVFARSVGADTDIVAKEMYTFPDHGLHNLEALREEVRQGHREFVQSRIHDLFLDPVIFFLRGIDRAFKQGHLDRTPAIHSAYENLQGQFSRYEQMLKTSPRDEFVPERELLRAEILIACEKFQFGQIVSLRPEATASVVRAYIEHGMHTLPGLVKLYYIGPMFRRERPQKGRYRQFYQIGAEVLGGSDHPAIDAEVIEMVLVFIQRCGLRGAELSVNSIGCGECRPIYVALLKSELEKVKSKLGPDSQRRIETNPLRVLDSKLEDEQPVIAKLPSILDHLCDACRAHFEKVKQELADRNIKFALNHRLVRGLDYYMRTTFEITAPGLGAQNAVCGGGRYDGLVELLGGPPTKGIGWALGTDRLVLALEQTAAPAPGRLDAFIVWLGEPAYACARALARTLRDAGLSVELPYEEMKMKKALGRADQLGARYALILGEDELRQGTVTLRDLAAGSQRSLQESELLRELMPSSL